MDWPTSSVDVYKEPKQPAPTISALPNLDRLICGCGRTVNFYHEYRAVVFHRLLHCSSCNKSFSPRWWKWQDLRELYHAKADGPSYQYNEGVL